ncbi:MAG TPA: PQQ-binding-like beta-propeller repeat protein [Rhizomicrobium sp.]|jgi:quinoprotein glucose dehydrogenase
MQYSRRGVCVVGAAAILASRLPAAAATAPAYDTANGEWRTYGGNLSSWRYSALDQINAGNFGKLRQVWSFHPDNLGPVPDPNLQSTPLMVKGTVYLTAGSRRAAVALNAATGEMKWKFNIDEGKRGANSPRPGSGRGLSYWTDGEKERILFVTIGYQLVCLDARTGIPVAEFGNNGIVDLKKDDDQDIDLTGERVGDDIGLHASPLVVGDVVVVGAAHLPGLSPHKRHVKGYVRGFDARTGQRLWIFHTIPKKGEFGYDTWQSGSAEYTGNAGNWCQNSADPELGLVYVGVEMPTGDWYGGTRPGNGLFGESIVALDVKTGQRRWHYQTVHHGFQDRDIPCASILCDITVDGRRIKAIAQPTKQAWLYVLDRETGKPVWPIPERPVPKGYVAGEWYPATQPMVMKPPAFDRQGMEIDYLIDFTPALRAEAEKVVADYRIGPLFTPPAASKWPRPLGTIMNPNGDGAGQWPGGALDPETNIFYIFSNISYNATGEVPADPRVTDAQVMLGTATPPATEGRPRRRPGNLSIQGMPLMKPPYGQITAIDLNRGEIVWKVPHGETPDDVRNNPALKGLTIPRTGSRGKVGVLITKTLVIAGDGTATTGSDGKEGGWLRAYDKRTGKEVGAVRLPTKVTGSPMTYALNGTQFIAVPVSGSGLPGQLLSFSL